MLRQLENDVGLSDLNDAEIEVYLAAYKLTKHEGDVVQSDQIRREYPVSNISPATYHRALTSLLKAGFLRKSGDSKAKHYVVQTSILEK